MITKERLEELIEKGATIYGVDDRWDIAEVRELDAQQIYYSSSNDNYQYVFDDHSCIEFFEDELFETKEDAEEYAEFGNVTRTERLKLPSWEDFKKTQIFLFESKEKILMELAVWESIENRVIKVTTTNDWNVCFFNKPLTRENYNEARRLCVKLFKGEKV